MNVTTSTVVTVVMSEEEANELYSDLVILREGRDAIDALVEALSVIPL